MFFCMWMYDKVRQSLRQSIMVMLLSLVSSFLTQCCEIKAKITDVANNIFITWLVLFTYGMTFPLHDIVEQLHVTSCDFDPS